MGKGSRLAKAKTIVLVPGIGGSANEMQAGAAAVATAEVEQQAPAPPEPISAAAGPTSSTLSEPEPQEVIEPSLAELQVLKEQIRKEHLSWYPEYRDTLGHQFNEQLVPQLTGLSATELGLSATTDPDRVRREIRALAFARSYLMAQVGDVEGLKAISPDLLYFWDDRLGGTLVPPPSDLPQRSSTLSPGHQPAALPEHGRSQLPLRRPLPLPPLRIRGQGLDRRSLEGAPRGLQASPQRQADK